MRIAINTRLLIEGKLDGIGWFTYETTRRLVAQHPEHQFFLFFDRQPSEYFQFPSNTHIIVLAPPARHPILWYMFFEWSITNALRKHKIDLFLSPDGWLSLRTKVPTLDVIHDINFEHTKGNLKPSHQWFMSHFFPKYAKRADRIVTVSDFSRNDIASTYKIPIEKIGVVYDGAHDDYHPIDEEEKQHIRNQYTNGAPYFIFISTIIKRKNLTNLLLAFDKFKDTDNNDTKLIVAGARVWWQDELESAFSNMRHQKDVIFTGRTENKLLSHLLASAEALVYPSFFEGFGMPILEAFYAETAVITSNCTSMPEIAGDAALLTDPNDVEAIASAIAMIANDKVLREDLISKGRTQRQKFNWDITSDLLWNNLMQLNKS